MNILLLLILVIIILLYINYKKYYINENNIIINDTNKIINENENNINIDTIKKNKKSVSWSSDNTIIKIKDEDYNIYENYTNDNNELDELLTSNVTEYLSNLKDSYNNSINIKLEKRSSIAKSPYSIIDLNDINDSNDSNHKIQDLRDEKINMDNMTIADVYDNLVDDYRTEWGKINNLDTYNTTNFYNLDTLPENNGYTNFPTY